MSQQYPFQCNIAQALNIIGDKWSLLILHGIMSGHQTYKEIYNLSLIHISEPTRP